MNDKSLKNTRPELALEWSERNMELTPDDVTYGSNRKVWWKGLCGHEWEATVKSRAVGGNGCPYCANTKVLPGFNDLASQQPDLASEWSEKNENLGADMVTQYSSRKVWWAGRCGHEWQARVSDRTKGHGCPYCKDHKVLPGFNDLKSLYPDLAAEWSDRNKTSPSFVTVQRPGMVWWKCSCCGNEYEAWIASRINGTSCPYCRNKRIMPGVNDLASKYPEIAECWDYERNTGTSPKEVMFSSKTIFWWNGRCGHSWKARAYDMTVMKMQCPVCEQNFVADLPRILMRYYCGKNGLAVQFDDEKLVGIPIEMYIPELLIAIDNRSRIKGEIKIQLLKEVLCKKRHVKYILLDGEDDPDVIANSIIAILKKGHLYIDSDPAADVVFFRKRYLGLMNKLNDAHI